MKSAIALFAGAVIWSVLVVHDAGAQPAGPSFNCDMARTADKRAICADARLAELDQAIAIAFSLAATKSKDAARGQAKDILAARRPCGADRLCILDQQVSGIETFSALGSQVPVPIGSATTGSRCSHHKGSIRRRTFPRVSPNALSPRLQSSRQGSVTN